MNVNLYEVTHTQMKDSMLTWTNIFNIIISCKKKLWIVWRESGAVVKSSRFQKIGQMIKKSIKYPDQYRISEYLNIHRKREHNSILQRIFFSKPRTNTLFRYIIFGRRRNITEQNKNKKPKWSIVLIIAWQTGQLYTQRTHSPSWNNGQWRRCAMMLMIIWFRI